MKILPVINCQDFETVKSRMKVAVELLSIVPEADRWVHIDIADGGFTDGYSTWRNPTDLAELKLTPDIKIELHLMVNEPEQAMEAWFTAGISRLVFHLETTSTIEVITSSCHSRGVEPMLAIGPQTPVAHAMQYCTKIPGFQLLAVKPGKAGQELAPGTLEKIKAVRNHYPDMIIEVDGGVVPETAKQMREAGATQAVSGSYIFNSSDPAKAFKELLDA